jgi:hypothetical protein
VADPMIEAWSLILRLDHHSLPVQSIQLGKLNSVIRSPMTPGGLLMETHSIIAQYWQVDSLGLMISSRFRPALSSRLRRKVFFSWSVGVRIVNSTISPVRIVIHASSTG